MCIYWHHKEGQQHKSIWAIEMFFVFLYDKRQYILSYLIIYKEGREDKERLSCAVMQKLHETKTMAKLTVNNYDELAARLGEKLGESEWLLVDQERINLFADATLDHQWIHVDTERAAVESQFKSTIAHGYLTLSLLPHMWQEIIEVNNLKMMVNYGMDKMRFGRPVLVNSRIRLVATLDSIENIRGICKAGIKFQIEIEGERKPALEGVATFLYYFE